jgi:impB/mucB/samB family protein
MPSVTAKRQCPDLIFVKPRFEVYRAVSQQIREIFAEHTPIIEPLSLDEAYLDVTENLQGIPLARDVALAIRATIKEVSRLDGARHRRADRAAGCQEAVRRIGARSTCKHLPSVSGAVGSPLRKGSGLPGQFATTWSDPRNPVCGYPVTVPVGQAIVHPTRGLHAMAEARPTRIGRRLSAIVAADVAGYSRLMQKRLRTPN